MKELFDKVRILKVAEVKRARMMMSKFLLTEAGNTIKATMGRALLQKAMSFAPRPSKELTPI